MTTKILELLARYNIENLGQRFQFVDLRFTDTKGKEQHITVPASVVDEDFFENGKMFDGSSIAGWKNINESDMILMPDPTTGVMDPFSFNDTLIIRCDVVEPMTGEGYDRDPRTIAKRAEEHLAGTGIADTAFFGPEAEFFVFDNVRWNVEMHQCSFEIDSEEGAWESGHRPVVKGGYFPVPPVDSLQDVRNDMCSIMMDMGLEVEVHHHEVGTAGQCEIGTKHNSLVRKADELQIFKYVVHNVAKNAGKTATFMPKPLVGENGNGMHVHQSLSLEGKNIFDGAGRDISVAGDKAGGLTQEALWYIGGIFKHAKALNAFTNSTTNSYKRLVPGFEAPVLLAYSACNRSASVRIPFVFNSQARRIEVRFPDGAGNPYLTFSAMLMAGLDGIKNKIDPGWPIDEDLYDSKDAWIEIDTVSGSLYEALTALDKDHDFLTAGGVFTNDMIYAYINLKMEEVDRMNQATHPVEFDMYYSV